MYKWYLTTVLTPLLSNDYINTTVLQSIDEAAGVKVYEENDVKPDRLRLLCSQDGSVAVRSGEGVAESKTTNPAVVNNTVTSAGLVTVEENTGMTVE